MKRVGTGVKRLDDLLGGGQVVGATSVLLHDGRCRVAQQMTRCFIGEGICSVSPVLVIFIEELFSSSELPLVPRPITVKKSSSSAADATKTEGSAKGEGQQTMKIAWRYGAPKVDQKTEQEAKPVTKTSFSAGSFGRRKKGAESGSLGSLRKGKGKEDEATKDATSTAASSGAAAMTATGERSSATGSIAVEQTVAENQTTTANIEGSGATTFVASRAFDLTRGLEEERIGKNLHEVKYSLLDSVSAEEIIVRMKDFIVTATSVALGKIVPRIVLFGLEHIFGGRQNELLQIFVELEDLCWSHGAVSFSSVNMAAVEKHEAALLAHNSTIAAELRSLEPNEAEVLGAETDAIYTQRKGYSRTLHPTTPNSTPMTITIGRRQLEMEELALPPELNASGGGSNAAATGKPSAEELAF